MCRATQATSRQYFTRRPTESGHLSYKAPQAVYQITLKPRTANQLIGLGHFLYEKRFQVT